MIVEVLRIVADALDDDEIGVNVELGTLPYDDEDDSDRPPAIEAVLDPTRDEYAAAGEIGPTWPVLVVTQDGPVEVEPERGAKLRDHTVPVAIRYATGDANLARATRHGLYTLRALLRSLETLSDNEHVDRRKRNKVTLRKFTRVTWGQLFEKVDEESYVAAAMRLDVLAVDRN